MAKYQQYDEYKHTGVSWIPEMPQGWQVTKLKYLIKNLESGVSVNAADYPKSEGEFGVLKTSCVYTREFRAEENKTVFEEELSRVKCPVRTGSIIISRMNTPDLVGAAVYVKENYSNLYLPDRLWQTVYNDEETQSSKYLHYFMYLKGFRDQISNFAEGASSSMQSISKEDFLSINILLPTRDEQEGVANFLDHQTAQIDTLIDKQHTLIQLLKEKRQAVISHAVTKGLNPDVPMKDSGVEWLGEVPEHWNVAGFKKYLNSIIDYRGKTPEKVDSGKFLVTARNIKKGEINYGASQEYVSEKDYPQVMSRGIPEIGDVLFTTEAPLGEVAQVDKTDIALAQRIIKFSGQNGILDNTYLKFYIMSNAFQDSLMTFATGSTALGIKSDRLSYLRQLIPPLKEQVLITEYIEIKSQTFDVLIMKAEQAIQLMQERRTALISAAVTGKIDVRGWQVAK